MAVLIFIGNMDTFMNIIGEGHANVIVQVKAEDLLRFADAICEKVQTNTLEMLAQKEQDELISKKEAKILLGGVSDATLWRWEKEGYLIPERFGRKSMYRKSEIQGLMIKR